MRHTVQGQKYERKSTADMSITPIIEIDFATFKKSSIKFNYVFIRSLSARYTYVQTAL